jgi:hypothetical protein
MGGNVLKNVKCALCPSYFIKEKGLQHNCCAKYFDAMTVTDKLITFDMHNL